MSENGHENFGGNIHNKSALEFNNEEQRKKYEELVAYQEDLAYDMVNPETEQEKNNEIMKGLFEKYPHAFFRKRTDDGRSYLVLKRMEGGQSYPTIFTDEDKDDNRFDVQEGVSLMFSEYGVASMNLFEDPKELNFTPLLDSIANGNKKMEFVLNNRPLDIKRIQSNGESKNVSIRAFQCKDYKEIDLNILQKIIRDKEQYYAEYEESLPKDRNSQEIIDSL